MYGVFFFVSITDAVNKQRLSEKRPGRCELDNVALSKFTDQIANTDDLSASGEDVEEKSLPKLRSMAHVSRFECNFCS